MVNEHIPESIAERYQIKSVLGRGGMGMVLHAFDPFLGIDVALKYMRSDDSGLTAARMQREASAAGKLKHANIARVYDFGKTAQDEPYMVMELLLGQSLAQKLQELRPSLIDPQEAVSIFIQICDGLHSAHAASIIHRDLKPDNIFVLDDGTVKIVDFGIAQIGADQTITHTHSTTGRGFEGSPLYMSPEQARSEETDWRSDIYSFGCLMFEVLCGKPPFTGKSSLETVSMQINTPAPSLKDCIQADLPSELIDLVMRCLEKNPDKRPQNCDEVSSSLEAAYSSLKKNTVVAQAPNVTARELLIRKEEKLLKGLTAVLVILLLSIAGGLYIVLSQKKVSVASSSKLQQARISSAESESETEPEPEKDFETRAWPRDDVPGATNERKFEFGEYEGVYMARQKTAIGDEDLIQLKGLTRLRQLKLDYAQLDGSGLHYIADLPLTEFANNFGMLKDANLKYFTQIKTLKKLSIGSPDITDAGLKQLLPLRKLDSLGIASDKITDQSVGTIAQFTNLWALSLWAPKMTDAVVPSLYKMKNLETLYLINMKVKPDIGVKVAKMKRIKTLGLLALPAISDESMKAIAKLKLDWLDLGDTKLGDNQLALISPSLGGIGLRGTSVSAKNLENLKNHPTMNKIQLSSLKITDDHIRVLTRMKLTDIVLGATDLNFKQLLMLSNISTLKRLNIQECPNLSPDQIQEFQREFKLKRRRDCEVKCGTIEDEILERRNAH
ncbi:protein kinase [bacterium]|nr:protein kinase [bacterium]